MPGKLIIFSAPSGSGKSTIINWLMSHEELRMASVYHAQAAPREAQSATALNISSLRPKSSDAG